MYKILYVEDEIFLAKIVRESLESRGYDIKHVSDGGKAKEAYLVHDPDLCVLDVMLPNKDGYSIAEEIRHLDSKIPIIFLTAKDQTEDVVTGFKTGGNDYLKKPFSMEELIVRIENLLDMSNRKAEITKETRIGKYTFHPLPMRLEIDTEKIQLSHRENEIIKLMCLHKNNRIDRKKILMEIWGDDSFFNSRNLDVYMRKIRKYFEADEQIQIVTLKGVGYHFLVEEAV